MVIEACRCDDGFGVAHTHYTRRVIENISTGRVITVTVMFWLDQPDYRVLEQTDDIRIWVPWKDVARGLGLPLERAGISGMKTGMKSEGSRVRNVWGGQ